MVVASIITLFIAINSSNSLVRDDYYKEGLAINTDLRKVTLAKELGIEPILSINSNNKTLTVRLKTKDSIPQPPMLLVRFIHPFDEAFDMDIPLQKTEQNNTWQQQYNRIDTLNWNVEVTPMYPANFVDAPPKWKAKVKFNPS